MWDIESPGRQLKSELSIPGCFVWSSLQPLSRPPIPSHQVPPYRAVSARFHPTAFSQSTPIGLDRVGRQKLHRVLSGGNCGCFGITRDRKFQSVRKLSLRMSICVGGKCCYRARCGCACICGLFTGFVILCQKIFGSS